MKNAPHVLIIFAITCLAISCMPPEELPVSFEQYDLGVDGELRSILVVNDSFYFCGGSGWDSGWVVLGTADLQETKIVLEADNLLFDLCLFEHDIYASSLGNSLYGLSSDGDNFLPIFIDDFQSIYALEANETDMYAVSGINARTEGRIWHYNKNEKALKLLESFSNSLQDLQLIKGRLIACGFGMTAYCDLDRSECTASYGLSESFKAVDCINDSICYAVAQSGGIAKSLDGGSSWFTIRPADRVLVANVPFQDIEMLSDSVGYICARKGHLWKTSNAGKSWLRLSGLPELDYFDLLFEEPFLYVACAEGQVLRIAE